MAFPWCPPPTITTTKRPTRRTKNAKTPEQRAEETKALHDTLTAQVDQLATAEGWQQWLTFLSKFHAYSLNNIMLIAAQKEDASLVAGFRQWQQRGRQVRAGEKSIKIFGYATRKVTDAETGEETDETRAYFPIRCVFDISQTDPIEGHPLSSVDRPNAAAERLTGDDNTELYAPLAAHLQTLGWPVTREPIPGATNGFTDLKAHRIVVDDQLAPAMATKTLIHEAGHALLHADQGQAHYVNHRGQAEVEAESVAYVVAGYFGLDTSPYSIGYVTGWAKGDTQLVRDSAGRVLHAAHQLIDALEPTADTNNEEGAA